ncbi:MAG: histidinol-phosphatase [Bacteroidetes bacterium]|nr:histidinol-phosphatase [Bacteroidota bacterium]
MAYLTDYHIHTTFSDGKAEPEDYIPAARAMGISEIGFSEHLTLTDEEQGWSINPDRLPEYFNRIQSLAVKTHDPVIRIGIEADYLPGKVDEILEYLNKYPFDYVIGSVHYMGTETVDLGREFYTGKDMRRIFSEYFDLVAEAASTGLFDIMAHPDLIRIFGHRFPGNPEHLYRRLARNLKASDVAFEINTNGMNKPLGEFYPDSRFLNIFAEEGVPLCINSDAHMPSRLAQHFDAAYALAAAAGFRETAVFKGRERFMIPIYE